MEVGVAISRPVFASLQPSIFMARLFGLAPVRCLDNGKYYVIQKSKLFIAYSYIVVTLSVGLAVTGIFNDFDPEDSTRLSNVNQRYIVLSDVGIILLGVFVGVIQTPFRLNHLFKIINAINKINGIMRDSPENIVWQRRVSSAIWATTELIFILIVGLDIFAWSQKTIDQKHYHLYLKRYFSFYVLYTVAIVQGALYCNMAYLIKRRVINLNDHMRKEIQRTTIFKTKMINFNEMTAQRVTDFMKVHENLFVSVTSVNDCYGYPVLFILMSCILHLVITPFYVITQPAPTDLMIIQTLWIFVHILRLVTIVESTHSCLAESAKTNPLIVQLFSKTEDHEVRHKIEVFALQGKLCELQFSSCGIVTLKRSVLASVAGAVTTYLVILIQLNSA